MSMYIQQLKCCAFFEFSGFDYALEPVYSTNSWGEKYVVKYNFAPIKVLSHIYKAYVDPHGAGVVVGGVTNTGQVSPSAAKKPFVMFTEVIGSQGQTSRGDLWPENFRSEENRYGKQLAKLILDNKLGHITETPYARNWTGSLVVGYIWKVDWPKVNEFLITNGIKIEAPK